MTSTGYLDVTWATGSARPPLPISSMSRSMMGPMSSSPHRSSAEGRKAGATRFRYRRRSLPSMASMTGPMTGPMVSALTLEESRWVPRGTRSTSSCRVTKYRSWPKPSITLTGASRRHSSQNA